MLPLVAGLLLCVVCVRLALWQLDRAEFKRTLQAQIEAPLAAQDVADAGTLRVWQRVKLRGTWLAGQHVFLDNQMRDKQPGYELLSLLQLDNAGGFVVVNRGWVGGDLRRDKLPAVPPDAGPVELTGRVREPGLSGYRLDDGSDTGLVWQRADPALFAARIGKPVAPFVVQQESDTADGLRRDWPRYESDENKHRAYAFQWFALASLSLGLAIWFVWRSLRKPA